MERDYFVNICFEQNDNQVAGASQYSFDEVPNAQMLKISILLTQRLQFGYLSWRVKMTCAIVVPYIVEVSFAIYTQIVLAIIAIIVLGLLWLRFLAHATITNPFSWTSAASL